MQLWSAGYDRDAAAAAPKLESPLKDLATAEKLGMRMWPLNMALRTMTFDEAQRLHRHHPELLASNLVVLLTPAELAELCKSGAIPTSGDLTGPSKTICDFLDAGVAPRDIAWLVPAGAQPAELARVKRDGGSLDDYVKLRKAGWSAKCFTGLGHWAADEVVTLVEVFRKLGVVGSETFEGNEPRAFNRIKEYGELGLTLAQATALAREGCTVDTLEKYYLSVGLTVDQAIKAIVGGG
ncbi:MAG: hypothetical protein IPJ65_41785 [Archangiaceae bacterium]|nr:hypothetical protein [Archangiaceae bacterium]